MNHTPNDAVSVCRFANACQEMVGLDPMAAVNTLRRDLLKLRLESADAGAIVCYLLGRIASQLPNTSSGTPEDGSDRGIEYRLEHNVTFGLAMNTTAVSSVLSRVGQSEDKRGDVPAVVITDMRLADGALRLKDIARTLHVSYSHLAVRGESR